MAIHLTQLDISQPLPDALSVGECSSLWVLVKNKGVPLGYLHMSEPDGEISGERLAAEIESQLGVDISTRRPESTELQDEPPAKSPFVSILICTKDRTDSLRRTLDSLSTIEYSSFEVLIVDNRPSDEATEKLAADYGFRYVKEMGQGVSWARNRGILEAHGDIVVFLDDDMLADPRLLTAVAGAFENQDVMCVTGNVLPAELETKTQELFEIGYGGFGNGFEPISCGRDGEWAEHLYGLYHHLGFVMAFRKTLFDRVALYDVAFGCGTIAQGGEDVDMIHRIALAGSVVSYAPDAIVFHYHRRDYPGLKRQLAGYGCAYLAVLTKCFIHEPALRVKIARRVAGYYVNAILKRAALRILGRGTLPLDCTLAEFGGALKGSWAYLRSEKYARQIKRLSERR